jgi:predicted  nucleic acid-binding Zn-ribbon protein
MSDIDRSRMIPLHIADQAVAACEVEITSLKAEVQRLKHRAEGLREAGDELWFCIRHAKSLSHAEVQEAVEDWQDMRAKQ